MYYSASYDSPVGGLTLVAQGDALVGLWMGEQKYYGATLLERPTEKDDLPVLVAAKAWLDRYFAGERPLPAELSLAPFGGEFRQEVWAILCEIPYGETMTYGDIAKIIAQKRGKERMSSQAVGGAVGHNPISLIIPCHRVVGAKGNLTGYAGGLSKKIALLEHEGLDMTRFFLPRKGGAPST